MKTRQIIHDLKSLFFINPLNQKLSTEFCLLCYTDSFRERLKKGTELFVMHHAFSPSGAGESSSTSRHSFLRFLPCSRPFACLGLRACTTLLLLLALSVISPLFFTERIRQINLHLHPAQQQSSALAISGQMLSVDNLAHVPLFKKQPRDRLTKLTPKYTLEPSICSGKARLTFRQNKLCRQL